MKPIALRRCAARPSKSCLKILRDTEHLTTRTFSLLIIIHLRNFYVDKGTSSALSHKPLNKHQSLLKILYYSHTRDTLRLDYADGRRRNSKCYLK